jgi:hypothetical protein
MLASVARDIDPPALARTDSATTRRHVAVEINKAFGEFACRPVIALPMCRLAQVFALLGVAGGWNFLL